MVGNTKFHYDLWGDPVNTASRMESNGVPGRIQMASGMHELIKDDFICVPRGLVEIKGKGLMETWFLEGVRPESPLANGSQIGHAVWPASPPLRSAPQNMARRR